MYIFWDNSNIQFSGANCACGLIEPQVNSVLYRTYFKNLFELVRKGRTIQEGYVAGSIPPPSDDLWNYITGLGVTLNKLDKTSSGKEQDSVDIWLQNKMLHTIIDESPSIMAVLTGDGAGALSGDGFLAELKRAHNRGWAIEVYAWDCTCNRHLKQFAENNGTFIALEQYYYSISFIKGGRIVAPL
jgi:hypothetical protein